MIENVIEKRKISLKGKLTLKLGISLGIVVLAVAMPLMLHLAVGANAGITWLPMYLPILLGGCLLGAKWGMGIGITAPFISYMITSLFGTAMPTFERLPFMMAELMILAFISGLFSKYISKKSWLAFTAVLLAEICGRLTFISAVAIFKNATYFTTAMVWSQIKSGLAGLVLQVIIAPLLIIGLNRILNEEKKQ